MTQEDIIIYGTLSVISIITGIIIWWGVRVTKEQEQEGINLKVEQVIKHYGTRISSKEFLWGIWVGRFSVKQMELFIKNQKGDDVAKITFHSIPQGDATRTIEIGSQKYDCINNGAVSNRSSLKDCNDGKVLMTCEHKTLNQVFYEGQSDKIKFTKYGTSVLKDFQTIKIGEREVGQLISMLEFKCDALLLTLPVRDITLPEKLFILACIPRGR
ncbi:MAG: hypothetical protein PQ612_05435 [Rickettsiales bacterium]|nr:hypothetical protein [Pseudomonadota bacterium]MDA0966462.1 hypothetical protein [Pseudomonadota bacterium]MDG4543324.1 hypothetical protein [Rickettsiales bacterium]MDG4545590.1 hypothetical protein [Rickettsiales bacterium]MDG4548039.1 hypothetical protein [Rickettsiales bacterium]